MYAKKSMEELDRLSPEAMQQADKHRIIVIMDDVRSMHNVGAAFRTCDAFAIEALYLCGYTPAPPHRDIHKTALGATDTVTWKHFKTTTEAVQAAKDAGYKIWAVEQAHESTLLQDYAASGPVALVFGNEVTGVSDEVLAMADGCVEIPQFGSKHSLNISVSMGVVLWEVLKKERKF